MKAVLAIDQGTTGSTAMVLDGEGRLLGRAYGELTQHYPQPGWVEHDPQEIWTLSLRVMAEALRAGHVEPRDLAGIGITNQRETAIVWDRRRGVEVHPAIVWQSRQSAEICERLRAAGHGPRLRERTGLVVDAYFSGTKIAWILERYPEALARARDGEVLFGTVDTWLLWKMTGGAVHATEPTNASRTLLYDIGDQRFSQELLDILGVPAAMLPEVRPSCGRFGATVAHDGLPGGIPVMGIAGDQQAALFGQGCWQPGEAKNTYGTGCFLMMNMGQAHPVSTHGLLTTMCCDAQGQPARALEGSVFVAGAAVQWLRDELQLVRTAAETAEIAASVPDAGGVHVVPAFAGLGAPYWDMGARGAVLGLTRGSSRAHLVRATLESIAFQTRDVVEAMDADAGSSLRELKVDGGACANDVLMQFQADILGIPVDRPAQIESTAMGAAFLAGLGGGLWSGPEQVRHVRRRERRFEPRMGADERESRYAGWQEAVARVRTRG